MKLNAVADRFISAKGPFQDIPVEVYDKFLLRYLQAYGITDAPYWIQMIRSSRDKAAKEQEKAQKQATAVPQQVPGQPQIIPGQPQLPPQQPGQQLQLPIQPPGQPGTTDMLQANGITPQPNPLEQIFNAQTQPPIPQIGGIQ